MHTSVDTWAELFLLALQASIWPALGVCLPQGFYKYISSPFLLPIQLLLLQTSTESDCLFWGHCSYCKESAVEKFTEQCQEFLSICKCSPLCACFFFLFFLFFLVCELPEAVIPAWLAHLFSHICNSNLHGWQNFDSKIGATVSSVIRVNCT